MENELFKTIFQVMKIKINVDNLQGGVNDGDVIS